MTELPPIVAVVDARTRLVMRADGNLYRDFGQVREATDEERLFFGENAVTHVQVDHTGEVVIGVRHGHPIPPTLEQTVLLPGEGVYEPGVYEPGVYEEAAEHVPSPQSIVYEAGVYEAGVYE